MFQIDVCCGYFAINVILLLDSSLSINVLYDIYKQSNRVSLGRL